MSIDTVRASILGVLALVLGVVAFFAYQQLAARQVLAGAGEAIKEATALHQLLEGDPRVTAFSEPFQVAASSLRRAVDLSRRQDHDGALSEANQSKRRFQAIKDVINNEDREDQARFVAVQGGVEYRRGTGGTWIAARNRLALRAGDYVKTSGGGSAEILFVDGTFFTINPNSVILVKRRSLGGFTGHETIALEYGGVHLNTSQSASTVSTPKAAASIETESVARVAYDRDSGTTRFAALQGELVVSADGEESRVGTMQQVTHSETIGTPRPLLPAPTPLAPAANHPEQLSSGELVLTWQKVPGADGYSLQVSRNRLFVDNIIDVENRTKTSAKLGLREEGHFLWRVAAIDQSGEQGPWSPPRIFRVLPSAGDGEEIPSGP